MVTKLSWVLLLLPPSPTVFHHGLQVCLYLAAIHQLQIYRRGLMDGRRWKSSSARLFPDICLFRVVGLGMIQIMLIENFGVEKVPCECELCITVQWSALLDDCNIYWCFLSPEMSLGEFLAPCQTPGALCVGRQYVNDTKFQRLSLSSSPWPMSDRVTFYWYCKVFHFKWSCRV